MIPNASNGRAPVLGGKSGRRNINKINQRERVEYKIGKSVQIIKGFWKGKIGIIVDGTATHRDIELHSRNKTVTVQKNEYMEVYQKDGEVVNNDEDNDLDDFLYPFKELKNGDEKLLKTKQKILLNAEKEAKKIIKKAKQKANKIIKQAKQKTSNSQNTIKTQTSSDEEKQKNIDQLIQQSIKELIPKEQTIII